MQKLLNSIYGLMLILLMIVPSLGILMKTSHDNSCEKRNFSTYPKFSWTKAFLDDFEVYFKEHFAFRNQANLLNSSIKFHIFNSSSRPHQAIAGKDGWCYYTSSRDQALDSYTHANLFSEDELKKAVALYENRKQNLNAQQIKYYLAVWPAKPTIYPEYVPWRLQILQQDTLSGIDQVINYLSDNESPLNIIDVRERLLKEKAKEKIYHQHDSHWNKRGAYFAYCELMQHMEITPYEKTNFNVHWEYSAEGDLKALMGLCNSKTITESRPYMEFKESGVQTERVNTDVPQLFKIQNNFADSEQRILIFRDSYTSAMVDFISLHFKESCFMWSDYREDIVTMVKPDIVVEAKAERYFPSREFKSFLAATDKLHFPVNEDTTRRR